MKCQVCGKEFEKKWGRVKFCSPECYHKHRKNWKSNYSHEKYLQSKKQKHACMMCGLPKCKDKYQICKSCKQTDVYQSEGYGSPCPIHS
jgi:hypothetical protein